MVVMNVKLLSANQSEEKRVNSVILFVKKKRNNYMSVTCISLTVLFPTGFSAWSRHQQSKFFFLIRHLKG